jgi:hypothetical protein
LSEGIGPGTDMITSIEVKAGSVFTAGSFEGNMVLGSQPSLQSTGETDAFFSKHNAATGAIVNAGHFGGTSSDGSTDLAVDDAGNMYITGSFFGSIALGSSSFTAAGINDGFIVKLDNSGTPLWANHLAGNSYDSFNGVKVDATGKVYTTGYFTTSASMAGKSLTAKGLEDVILACFNGTTGAAEWSLVAGSSGFDQGIDIAMLPGGTTFISGYFEGNFTIGQKALETSINDRDMFIAKVDASGIPKWAIKAGGTGSDSPAAIYANTSFILTTGSVNANVTFLDKLLQANNLDAFVWKIQM